MGLLTRGINTPLETKNIASSFQQWARLNDFDHCGVFCCYKNLMLMEHAYGVDASTIFSSISTKDFWIKSISTKNWVTLNRESPNFSAFTQFLGKDSRSNVDSIRILKLENDSAFYILFLYDFTPFGSAPDIKRVSDTLLAILENKKSVFAAAPTKESISGFLSGRQARLCYISLKTAIEAATTRVEVSEQTIQKILIKTIFDEIFYITKKLFPRPDFVYSENTDEIKVAAIISNEVEDEMMCEHICLEYKDILGHIPAHKVTITNAGYSADADEILDYLLRG